MSAPGSGQAGPVIREARAEEHDALGALIASSYASLPGMPGPDDFPEYYAQLRDVAGRAALAGVTVLVAVGGADERLLGGVIFVGDMRHYGADAAVHLSDAAGIRMLAVDAAARGLGVGRALTEACLERARVLGRAEVVLHTMDPMDVAHGLYERLGFRPDTSLDFGPGDGVVVRGFRRPVPD